MSDPKKPDDLDLDDESDELESLWPERDEDLREESGW